MKKSILIIGAVLTTLSLTAYTYIAWESSSPETEIACSTPHPTVEELPEVACRPTEVHPDFQYKVSNEFNTTITLEDLQKANSVVDLLPAEATENLSSYRDVKMDVVPNDNTTAIEGVDENLNDDQLELLKSMNYSSNFYLEARCKNINTRYGPMDNYHLVYYLTVVPEVLAQYNKGQDALLKYLKKGSENKVAAANWSDITPGRLHFTITKDGSIKNIFNSSSCGSTSIDEQMLELIRDMPGKWQPAKDANGNTVAQEFVFFYGKQGC